MRGGERRRVELADLLGLDQHRVAVVLAQLADDVVSADGWVRLKPPPTEREHRRSRSPEHLRLVGERRAADADGHAEIADVREPLLGGDLLTRERVPSWVEERARSGEPVGTTLEYAGPTDTYVRRVSSTTELEPLRRLSERLARRYGWQAAQATIFILSGLVPVVGARVTVRHALPDPGGPARWTVDFDSDEDAEVVANAIRRAQREHAIARRPKSADAERKAQLAPFVAEHGDGVSAFEQWNREHPDHAYATRSTFHRAARRVRRAS